LNQKKPVSPKSTRVYSAFPIPRHHDPPHSIFSMPQGQSLLTTFIPDASLLARTAGDASGLHSIGLCTRRCWKRRSRAAQIVLRTVRCLLSCKGKNLVLLRVAGRFLRTQKKTGGNSRSCSKFLVVGQNPFPAFVRHAEKSINSICLLADLRKFLKRLCIFSVGREDATVHTKTNPISTTQRQHMEIDLHLSLKPDPNR